MRKGKQGKKKRYATAKNWHTEEEIDYTNFKFRFLIAALCLLGVLLMEKYDFSYKALTLETIYDTIEYNEDFSGLSDMIMLQKNS